MTSKRRATAGPLRADVMDPEFTARLSRENPGLKINHLKVLWPGEPPRTQFQTK